MWNLLKREANELICKTETDSYTLNQTYGHQRGWLRGGTNWQSGNGICTLWCIDQLANRNLLYSTGNSTQYSVIIYMGKESEK